VRSRAQAQHLRLRRALDSLRANELQEELERVLVRTADLLYIIRSNLMHGEKFAGDGQRSARDRIVAAAAIRVLALFFDLTFDRPSTRLAAYGSLRSGRANAAVLQGIDGLWEEGSVVGMLEEPDGVPLLRWGHGGNPVEVMVLASNHLPEHFERLDEFEGGRYERILVPVDGGDGSIMIANVYAAPTAER